MSRKIADCRRYPSTMNCTLTISGSEDEVVRAAAEHAASVHGESDTPQVREQIRGTLLSEEEFARSTGTNGDGQRFVQLIEFHTPHLDRIDELMDEWVRATGGQRTATRSVLTADHEAADTYYEFVEFPSYEEAMRNSRLPETDEFARRITELCDSEPTFHDLDVVRDQAL